MPRAPPRSSLAPQVIFAQHVFGWGPFAVGAFLSAKGAVGFTTLVAFRPAWRCATGGPEPNDVAMGQMGAAASVHTPLHRFLLFF